VGFVRSYRCPLDSCWIPVIPVDSSRSSGIKYGREPSQIVIPEMTYSSGIESFLCLDWNGPWNGQDWNETGIK